MEQSGGSVRRVPITIYDREYLVRTDESVQHINGLAHDLDQLMRRISGGNPNILEVKVAVLAALTVLDEKRKVERKYEELLGILAAREDGQECETDSADGQRVLSDYE